MPESDVLTPPGGMTRDTQPAISRIGKRSIWRKVHLWAGLVLALPSIALGLSGTLLMFEPGGGTAVMASTIRLAPLVDAARQASGGATGDVMIRPPHDANGAVEIRIGQGPGAQSVSVDPVTRAVTPVTASMWRFIHDLHGNFLAGPTGRKAVGWSGAAMFLLIVTGAVLWWPSPGRLRAALTPRFRGSAYAVLRNLHPIIGAVMGIVLAVIAATGFDLGVLPGGPRPEQPDRQAPSGSGTFIAPNAAPLDADAILAAAQNAAGDAPWRMIVLPRNLSRPARVVFAASGSGPVTIQVDATDGHVLPAADPPKAPAATSIPLVMRQLHTGQNWGPVWWLLVAVSGGAMAGLAASGVASWWLRQIGNSRRAARQPGGNP